MKVVLVFLFAIVSASTFAADLFVKEFGGGGTYSTINDAMAVANANDRILVAAKAGDAPYIENLSITKPLQILTATNGSRYTLQGNITIATTLPAGSSVVLDGLSITIGNITASASTAAISLYIVNSTLSAGTINCGTRVYTTIANSTITTTSATGYAVTISNGKIVGNIITAFNQGISIISDAVASLDTVNIVGNKVELTGTFASNIHNAFTWANSTQFFNISNNYFNQVYSSYQGGNGNTYNFVSFTSFKAGASTPQYNNFNNNTVRWTATFDANSITTCLAGTLDARCNVLNNLTIFSNTGLRRHYNLNGNPQFSYNTASGGVTFNSGNTPSDPTNSSVSTVYNVTTNGCISTVPNTGHPDPIFTDLDLTRNDVGPCGGSYNITTNFLTPGTAGTGKVHWLEAPRRVSQGSTLSIEAEGHDR